VFLFLLSVWLTLPWIKIGGYPAVFFDLEHSNLFLFGSTYNAQDAWLLSFMLTAIGLVIVYVTALAGRGWCGWACPQTVFLDGVYRAIERLVEGPRELRLRRMDVRSPGEIVGRHVLTHVLYGMVSLAMAIVLLTYFVTPSIAISMVRRGFIGNSKAMSWVLIVGALLYFNFSWFREQLCVVICPYGRLQSVLLDEDSLVIGYDSQRGEPRGRKDKVGAGDCVDCRRCIAVCPTGIDIRNGVQLECIACTACIDACDGIMTRLDRRIGLVRYDSQAGLSGKPRRFIRPRLLLYTALLAVGGFAASVVTHRRLDFEVALLRLPGGPYTVDGNVVVNAMQLHLVNKRSTPERYRVEIETRSGLNAVVPIRDVSVAPLGDARAPVVLSMAESDFHGEFPVIARVISEKGPIRTATVSAMFLGPSR
jgi:cytochrome c oxidase accessory protein FixG